MASLMVLCGILLAVEQHKSYCESLYSEWMAWGARVSSGHVCVAVQVFAQQAAEAQEQKVPRESGWRS